jgi:hypothetical protein
MNSKTDLVESVRGLSRLMRPTYSAGLLLQDDDLTQAVAYTRDLSRLLFRTLFGCGVLCGLTVGEPTEACGKLTIVVHKGVALACTGDPIEVPNQQTIVIDLCTAAATPDPNAPTDLWLVLCRYDKCCSPRTSSCTPDDEQPICVCTRERDGFEIRVLDKQPDCACQCSPVGQSGPSAMASLVAKKTATAKKKTAAAAKKVKLAHVKLALPVKEADVKNCCDYIECGDCYKPHYDGECACDCCCDCVVLAHLQRESDQNDTDWSVDHSVRRFVRPVLMRDPQIKRDQDEAKEPQED